MSKNTIVLTTLIDKINDLFSDAGRISFELPSNLLRSVIKGNHVIISITVKQKKDD